LLGPEKFSFAHRGVANSAKGKPIVIVSKVKLSKDSAPNARTPRPSFLPSLWIPKVLIVLLSAGCNMNSDNDVFPLDPKVTQSLFVEWRSPRFGRENPQSMNNPVSEWLIRSKVNAYQANKRLNRGRRDATGPGWCFSRFGQSSNELPDGRIVLIAGEHEDHYDPDFYIYNDVVVQHPDGRIDILGYPRDVFPPTDFHSATVVGNQIVMIGNLGYPDQRKSGVTQIMILDLANFEMSRQETIGTPPGWINRHRATLSEDGGSILIERGNVCSGDEGKTWIENIDDWRLQIEDWRWERLTDRKWPRWEVRRNDKKSLHLFEYQTELWSKQSPALLGALQPADGETLEKQIGNKPDLDAFTQLFKPPVKHDEVPATDEEEYGTHRIRIDGTIVRYNEESDCIRLTVEGELSQSLLDALARDLQYKLSRMENESCHLVPVVYPPQGHSDLSDTPTFLPSTR